MTTKMLQRRLHTFKMRSCTLLQDHLDALNKLVMDLKTVVIKKNELTNELTLARALLFSLTLKYRDIENQTI